MTLPDRLRELAETLDACNKESSDLCAVIPSLTSLKEMVIIMNQAAILLEAYKELGVDDVELEQLANAKS